MALRRIRSYLARWEKRRAELDRGADANLVRDSRRRGRIGFVLLLTAFIAALTSRAMPLPESVEWPVRVVVAVVAVGGLVLRRWSQAERVNLETPDPEKPPSILGRD